MKTKTWKINKLEKICEILDNKRVPISQKDRISGNYPYYGASGIVDYIDKYIFDEELVLIGEDGAKWGAFENSAFIASGKYWVNNHAHILKPNNETLINKFLVYFLNYSNLEKYITGATVRKLNQQKLKQIEIPLPPLQEQERIMGILDESFTKIDESIKILEQDLLNLDELMQSALQKAFNPLKDNAKENYKLPQGWEWKSLGEICFITDGTHKTPNYIKTGIPFLSVKNISKGFFDLSDIKYISLEEHNKLIKRAKPEFGDILICRIGTLGKAIKISLDFEFSIFVSLGLLKPKVKIISDYLVYFLNSYFIERWIDNNKVGGGTHTAKLNLNILEKCPIALPPLKEQEQIALYLDELSSHVKNLKQNYQMQIKNLQELKKSLLDKAFQGRL
ncbi:type I restriction/modification system, specificity subunit [Campylobacter lari]|uniref:restriction endonuclease subunit S n=1 Tax=Campylobacter lari TaxID=201 RepID=UPI0021522F4D|nr:restriction endonuclease subunit S [Campylobacter lari]MCR6535995.1 restriction endonuclease subunit S [Campylobacter lari]